jgi:hypothetical protein
MTLIRRPTQLLPLAAHFAVHLDRIPPRHSTTAIYPSIWQPHSLRDGLFQRLPSPSNRSPVIPTRVCTETPIPAPQNPPLPLGERWGEGVLVPLASNRMCRTFATGTVRPISHSWRPAAETSRTGSNRSTVSGNRMLNFPDCPTRTWPSGNRTFDSSSRGEGEPRGRSAAPDWEARVGGPRQAPPRPLGPQAQRRLQPIQAPASSCMPPRPVEPQTNRGSPHSPRPTSNYSGHTASGAAVGPETARSLPPRVLECREGRPGGPE